MEKINNFVCLILMRLWSYICKYKAIFFVLAFTVSIFMYYKRAIDLSSIVITFSTVALAYLTYQLVEVTKLLHYEAKKARELEEAPDVSVSFEILFSEPLLFLMVHNHGKANAKNIKIESDKKILGNISINDISIMSLSFLKIEQKYICKIGLTYEIIEQLGILDQDDTKIKFSLKYENEKGCEYEKEIVIDIIELRDILNLLSIKYQDANGKIMANLSPFQMLFVPTKNKPASQSTSNGAVTEKKL